jgi:hypothetical protein
VKSGRVPLMGVRRRFQGGRLGATLALMLITSLQTSSRERGMEDVEMSWILESNKGVRNIIESIGGKPYKRYRIYRKSAEHLQNMTCFPEFTAIVLVRSWP